MKMIKRMDEYDMKEAFSDFGRDYYSLNGYRAILDYYNDIDENIELDVIAICCEWTEYGDNAACDFEDMKNDYGYLYPIDEYMQDYYITEEDFDIDEYIDELIKVLECHTTVLKVSNGNYLVALF